MLKMQNLSLQLITDATMTDIFATTSVPEQLDPDMLFNDGHRLKIIVYRLVPPTQMN
jgi:hypothetical protein